jgi:hypothetical protein
LKTIFLAQIQFPMSDASASPKAGKSKHPKLKTVLAIVIPVVLAIVVIWYVNRSKKIDKLKRPDSLPDTPASQPVKAISSADFPLTSGSNNAMVKQLQNALIAAYGSSILPKYGADGDWGSETTTAVKNKLAVTKFNSQEDFNAAIVRLMGAASIVNNKSRATLLVDKWTSDAALQLIGGKTGTIIQQVSVDAFGAIDASGKTLFLGVNQKYPRDQYKLAGVTSNGNVMLEKLTGDGGPAGTYVANPDAISVA